MRKFFVFILTFATIFCFSACKQKDNLTTLSKNLTSYKINIDLNVEKKFAEVNQTIDYVNNTNSILKTIKFHLYPQYFKDGATQKVVPSTKLNNAYPNGMSYASFEINRVMVDKNDKTIVYENEYNSILSVDLNNSLMPDEKVEIEINYSFTLPNCRHRFGYGENTINLANFYPIVCVYENENFNTSGYNPNGDPFYSDMANYCVNISLDKQYIVAGTGEKTDEKIINGNKSVSFNAKMVRDFALVVSNKFEVLSAEAHSTKVEYYYFNDTHPNSSLKAGVDAIKTFNKLFGEYLYNNFTIVETDFIYGGMEYPNLIMLSTDIEDEVDYLNVIIHETAHQWWYGIVGNDEYKFPWLDEALTEFSTVLFYDYNENYQLTHAKMIEISKENYSLFYSVYTDVLGLLDTSMRAVDKYSTEPEYTYCTYVKGVLMYESLYQLLGEKDFIEGLKIYFENNKYKNALPENLINAFENASKKELKSFFSSWIDGKVVIR